MSNSEFLCIELFTILYYSRIDKLTKYSVLYCPLFCFVFSTIVVIGMHLVGWLLQRQVEYSTLVSIQFAYIDNWELNTVTLVFTRTTYHESIILRIY